MRKIRVWILKYISLIGLIIENIITIDELLTTVANLEKKEKKIHEFLITAGNYIHHLNQLGNNAIIPANKIKYYSLASHESNQCLTWLIQILEGKEIKAWKSKNTKDLIQKIKNKTLLMVKEDGKNVLPTRKM
tara:strand:- start:31 stop:429 length:399 start_codon:yes stop_codon:yes gene_type:complete